VDLCWARLDGVPIDCDPAEARRFGEEAVGLRFIGFRLILPNENGDVVGDVAFDVGLPSENRKDPGVTPSEPVSIDDGRESRLGKYPDICSWGAFGPVDFLHGTFERLRAGKSAAGV
jgi:hypothetical protein